jgi:hypothetical protein
MTSPLIGSRSPKLRRRTRFFQRKADGAVKTMLKPWVDPS